MGTQKKLAREIIEADADYVLALKGKHETGPEEVKTFLDDALAETAKPRPVGVKRSPAAANLAVLETVEKDPERLETRRYYQSAELDWFADRPGGRDSTPWGLGEAIRQIGGKRTGERRYYLSSLSLGVATFARARAGDTLRRLALNLLKREKTQKRGIKGKHLNASWDHAPLLRLLGVTI